MSDEIDLEALQNNIDESQLDTGQEIVEKTEESEFDLDGALDSYEAIELDGKVTEEDAVTKAKERGWNPEGKDKYGHSVSAIEFLERTPLFHKMDLMRGDIDEIKAQNKRLTEQSKLIAKKAIDDKARLVKEFKEEKEKLLNQELLDGDDISTLKDIDKKIEEHAVEPIDANAMAGRYEVAKVDFERDNDWYKTDYAMTTLADETGVAFAQMYFEENGVLPEPEVTFQKSIDAVKDKYPDMGKPKRQTRVASRTNRTVTNHRPTKKTISDLPDDQQAVARLVMESAELSEEDYLKTYEW
jgi:hypothetical protein